jgi:hypothetical protein
VPAEIEVLPSGHYRRVVERPQVTIVQSEEELKTLAQNWVDGMMGRRSEKEHLKTVKQIDQYNLMKLGATEELVMLEHVPNGHVYLVPAIIKIVEGEALIRGEAPRALGSVTVEGLKRGTERLELVREYRKWTGTCNYRTEVLETNLEQSLYGTARQVYDGTRTAVQQSLELRDQLDVLSDLFTRSAQEGAEKRVENVKLAAEVEAETLERVREALGKQGRGTGAGPAPAGPVGTPPAAGPGAPSVPDLPPPRRSPAKKK